MKCAGTPANHVGFLLITTLSNFFPFNLGINCAVIPPTSVICTNPEPYEIHGGIMIINLSLGLNPMLDLKNCIAIAL